MSRIKSLKNKVICITGASRGIGEQIAYKMAAGGCRLILAYHRDKDQCLAVSKKCSEIGAADVFITPLDLAKDDSIKEAASFAKNKYGQIDVLINNAATFIYKPLLEMSFDEIDKLMRVNLEGLIKFTSLTVKSTKECVINICSSLGRIGKRNMTTYCASKFGVRGFTQALAKEHPDLQIYVVNPGLTATKMGDWQGMKPKKVADIIHDVVSGRYRLRQGQDIDILDFKFGPFWRVIIGRLRKLKNIGKYFNSSI